MKKVLLLILCFLLAFQILGNDEGIKDSLLLQRSNTTTEDTSYVNLLYRIVEVYLQEENLDTALLETNKAIDVSRTLHYDDGIKTGYRFLVVLYTKLNNLAEAINYKKKLLNLAEDSHKRYKEYHELADLYYYKNDLDSSIVVFNQLISEAIENGDKVEEVTALNKLAKIYYLKSDIYSTLKYLNKAIKISENIPNGKGIKPLLLSYNNLGSIYMMQKDEESALAIFEKVIKAAKAVNYIRSEGTMYNNIAFINKNRADRTTDSLQRDSLFRRSLHYLRKSEQLREYEGDKTMLVNVYLNLAYVLGELNRFDEADKYMAKAVAIASKDKLREYNWKKGKLLYNKRDYDASRYYLRQSLEKYKANQNNEGIKKVAKLLSVVYEKNNKLDSALLMSHLYEEILQKTVNDDSQKAVLRQQLKARFEKEKLEEEAKNKILLTQEKEARARQKIISMAIGGGLLLIGVFAFILFKRLRFTQRQKVIIEKQKEETEKQKTIIEQSHKEITDSIHYAKYLQSAILPAITTLEQEFKDSFLLYLPKDIVSGDFYWFEKVQNAKLVAVADCTGHGVPGAMVSVVCSGSLTRSVKEFHLTNPSDILNKTRELVIETFAKSEEEVKDGMDIALCKIENNELYFCGANNPLWIVRDVRYLTEEQINDRKTIKNENKALIEIAANKQPVGLYASEKPFLQVKVKLYEGDSIYLFTDGYVDQFGGEKNKKFKVRPFKQLILSINDKTMKEQYEVLLKRIQDWKGDGEQVDDITVMGIRL